MPAGSVTETVFVPDRPFPKLKAARRVVHLCVVTLQVPTPSPVAVTVNELAPDFTLPSTTGEDVRLSQFRGKKIVLLEFYGMNFGTT